jgi:hypothetical protein
MNHLDAQFVSYLRVIINDELDKRAKSIEESENKFDVYDQKSEIEDIIGEYIQSNVTVSIEV